VKVSVILPGASGFQERAVSQAPFVESVLLLQTMPTLKEDVPLILPTVTLFQMYSGAGSELVSIVSVTVVVLLVGRSARTGSDTSQHRAVSQQ